MGATGRADLCRPGKSLRGPAMLTRCPSCATHFRVTAEQLKVRSGRVRCGACQHVFNALDALIEEPMAVLAPRAAKTAQRPSAPPYDSAGKASDASHGEMHELTVPPARYIPSETCEPMPQALKAGSTLELGDHEPPARETDQVAEPGVSEAKLTEPAAAEPDAVEPVAGRPEVVLAHGVQPDIATAGGADADEAESFPEPPPPPRRWPWLIGSLVALTALGLQAVLAFRVELAVLWPEVKPALVALCDIADCEVGLPAKVALVGIEASDLHPDSEHPGRLVLTATLKSRAPFAQQFPHLELTLTDTADKAIVRKILAPTDYLPPQTAFAEGMRPNADIIVTFGVDSGEVAASGYRLYVFYP